MITGQIVVCLGLVGILLVSSYGWGAPLATKKSLMGQFSTHISHIIFLMQENRAYDNFYGTYCLTTGKYCPHAANGIPSSTCVPLYPGTLNFACKKPYDLLPSQLSLPDLPHDWYSSHSAYDSGYMNNFYAAEGGNQTFGHYNGSSIPIYWDLAEQYALADNFFTSAMTYSLSNHWYMLGAAAPSTSFLQFPPWAPVSVQHQYLNESNVTPTIEDRLVNSSVSWEYYDFGLQKYANAITNSACCGGGSAYDLWNPLAAKHQSYAAKVKTHFVPKSQFFTDAAAGTLPNVSWLMPAPWQSDHAPDNLSDGQNWSASVVNALEASPQWNSTVLFISWDEYGGWYDHVRPPRIDAYGDAFRAPLLAIGPWVRQGFVDHHQMDFDSILHLMEARFGLRCLGPRDCSATLPLGVFNFNQTVRAPIFIPPFGNATYPMPLQSSGMLPHFDPMRGSPPAEGPPPSMTGFINGDED